MIIKGAIDEIRFRNDENGFTIAVIDNGGDPVICAGTFPPVAEGQTVTVEGDFTVHKKYGRQFTAKTVKSEAPEGEDGIVRFLGSGLIKGIGPALALRIVNKFGKNTFEVIEFSPSRLTAVNGISAAKAEKIAEAYIKIKSMQSAVMDLQSYGITLNTALKIYKIYGSDTVAAVKSNPYRLIEDVDGIGFSSADKIAAKLGIEHDSEFRIKAGIIYVLKESVRQGGNTCLPSEDVVSGSAELLNISPDKIEEGLSSLLSERRVRAEQSDGIKLYMLPSLYKAEKDCAVMLAKLIESADKIQFDTSSEIMTYENVNGISLHGRQREAVDLAVNSGVVLITGGPGTGKTTIIKCILEIFDSLKKKVILMAPTGRAAKRMSEASNRDAGTIHRTLGISGEKNSSMPAEKLVCDVAVIDEFSMVDVFLFEELLKRLNPGTKLVLVGDKDQLPSVGAGNILSDISESGAVPKVNLDKIYRQAEKSLIIVNAHAINRGEMPVLDDNGSDFFFIPAHEAERAAEITADLVSKRLPKYLGTEPERVQVLCPLKNGAAGTINLNRILQERLNGGAGQTFGFGDFLFKEGDKVMQTVNNYDMEWKTISAYNTFFGTGVFNGDIGTVNGIDKRNEEMTVLFEDGRQATYARDEIMQLTLAYAITIHKSQGSEFDAAVIPIMSAAPMIMTRNLLYTAITRAKRTVVLVGEKYLIKRMVDNNYVAKRYTKLKDFLGDAFKEIRLLYGVEVDDEAQKN